jgi:hypothetical protein
MKEINWSWPKGKLLKLREQSDALITRMIKLIAPRDDMTPQKIFEAALAPAAGAVPSVARPGCFVEWVGYVPVLCCWSGFMFRAIDIRMADPAEKWLNETGYQSMQQPYIYPEELDVRTMFRSRLEQMVQNQGFALRDVSSFGRDQAVSRLAANEWLRALLDKGPVDPIAMPASMMAVQQSLFT